MMEFLDEELFASYTQALVKSKDLLCGRMAPYDLSREISIIEHGSRNLGSRYNEESYNYDNEYVA